MTHGPSYTMNSLLRRGYQKQGRRKGAAVWAVPRYTFLKICSEVGQKVAYYKAVSISRELENSRAVIIIGSLLDSDLSDGTPTLHTQSSLLSFFLLVPNQEPSIKTKMAPLEFTYRLPSLAQIVDVTALVFVAP